MIKGFEVDPVIAFMILTIILFVGMGLGRQCAWLSLPNVRERCEACSEKEQTQCLGDRWSVDYIAGHCGRVE